MTNQERIEKFKNENVAVNCKTEEEARKFIEWCYENGFEWDISKPGVTHFYYYEDKTCYTFNFCDCEHLGYGTKSFHKREGYEVIKYKDFMKENKMTNLEAVASKGLIRDRYALCHTAHICKYSVGCEAKRYDCSKCEFNDNVNLCVKTLLEEYKKPIKLTRFEFDYLDVLREYNNPNDEFSIYFCDCVKKSKGYFKGITDTSMTIQEILDNCEIVVDDYDFGE